MLRELVAVCHVCGEPKDLALGRCAACGTVPRGADRALAVVCSRAVLDPAALVEAQRRIRLGEPLRPSAALRARAEQALRGAPPPRPPLSPREILLLVAGNLLLTPLLGYAAWFRLRTGSGPAGRQALWTTLACSVALLAAWLGWRFRPAS